MVWLLPDIGLTPAINGTGLQTAATQLSNQFNLQLVQRLQGINAEIIPLNIPCCCRRALRIRDVSAWRLTRT